jgi:glutathione S-transferase
MSNITLYTFPLSGHSHRVELFLSLLKLDAKLIKVDLANGEHKSTEFLAKNPAGQIPVLEDGEITLFDSNAILMYLANNYDSTGAWYPDDFLVQAKIQGFFSLAASKLAYGPCNARIINVFGRDLDKNFAFAQAKDLLGILEQRLTASDWLVVNHPTLADIAHYTYVAHAPEGDISLTPYPNIQAWLKRIEKLDGFVPMQSSKAGLLA